MLFRKITTGVVIQTFNDAGECYSQEFKDCDSGSVEYETEDGDPINVAQMPLGGAEYMPFTMIQPNSQC